MHYLTASVRWAMQLVQCTATLPRGRGLWNSCNALPHRLGQWVVKVLQYTAQLPGGSAQFNSCYALPPRFRAVGNATRAILCHTTGGQWAVELLQ